MKNKGIKLLSIVLSVCMLCTSSAYASEFTSGEDVDVTETVPEENEIEQSPNIENSETEERNSEDVSEFTEDETENEFNEEKVETESFSDSETEDEFSSEAEEETPEANLAGVLEKAGDTGSKAVVVEADIPEATSVSTTCTVYEGKNLEKQDYFTWASPITSYLTKSPDGYLMRIQAGAIDNKALIEYYDTLYNLKKTVTVPLALPIFGSFYESDSNYYILTGQNNSEKDNSKEVFCVTKYTKDWKVVGSCGIFGRVAIPVDGGSARMTINGNYLFVRTCRERYDGHQDNVTFSVDTSTMTIADSFIGTWDTTAGYVSHSFNQFIQVDNGTLLGVDHGDVYPRCFILLRYTTDISKGKFVPDFTHGENICDRIVLMNYGNKGSGNYTASSFGGFEYSSSSYLTAGNIDSGAQYSPRNVFVSCVPKNGGSPVVRYFTDYGGSDTDTATTPHLIKTGSDSFILMWSNHGKVSYTALDGKGNQVGSIYTMKGNLSDCKPAVINGKLIWYTWNNGTNVFYDVDLSDLSKNNAVKIVNGHKYTYGEIHDGAVEKKCSVCGKDFGPALVPKAIGYMKYKNPDSTRYYNYVDTDWEITKGATYDLKWIMGYEKGRYHEGVETAGDCEIISSDENVLSVKMTGSTTARMSANNSGCATLTIRARYNPETIKVVNVYVDKTVFSEKWYLVTVTPDSAVYNGKEQEKPEIEVRKGYSGPILTEGTDYSVSYEGDMVNVGIVNITITGKGDYVGTIKKSFEITTKSFRKCTVELSDYNLFYNKKEHKPEVTVKDGNQKLIENKDYTLKYENNVERGTASVYVTGMGNYSDSTKKEYFYIHNPRIQDCKITLSQKQFIYDGTEKKPQVTVEYLGDRLKEDTDYYIYYSDNIRAGGDAKVVVVGKGLYDEYAEIPFKIVRSDDLKKLSVTLKTDPSENIISGNQVKLSALAQGGSSDYTYKFLICDDKGNWFKLRDYGRDNIYIWTPGVSGKKILYVDVKDGNGQVKRAELPCEVKNKVAALTAKLTADPSTSIISGNQVKLAASGNGGTGSYTYKFLVCDDKGNWYKIRDFGNINICTWTPGAAGKKTLYVDVKDSAGTVKRAALSYEVKNNVQPLTVKLTADPSTSIISGNQVNLAASGKGGTGSYTYKFLVCDDKGNWYKIRDFRSINTCTWMPGVAGKKTLYVDVKDSAGTVKRAALSYEVKNKVQPLTVKFTADPSTGITSGKQVKLTAVGNGGTGSYTYKFLVCDDKENWYRIRDFGSGNTCIWIPGASGKKTLYVDVKDSSGLTIRQKLDITVK